MPIDPSMFPVGPAYQAPPTTPAIITPKIVSAAKKEAAMQDALSCEWLLRVKACAFARQMMYITAWRTVAANGDWGNVRLGPIPSEADALEKEFMSLPWVDGSKEQPRAVGVTQQQINGAIAAGSMEAYVVAARLAARDVLAFFSRTDYNLFYATSIGLPAPINYAPGSKGWNEAKGDNYARGNLRCRWQQVSSGGIMRVILKGSSFGHPDSVRLDFSAIRLAAMGQADKSAEGIVLYKDNPDAVGV